MTDLSVAAYVTRPEIGGGSLTLEDPGSYRVVSADPGGLVWVREEATSRWVHGRILTNARKDLVSMRLVVRAYGSTHSQLHERIATMLRAFEQFRYRVSVTIGGVEYRWHCQPADYAPLGGEGWDKFALRSLQQAYVFDIPRDPIPQEGTH